MRYPIVYQSLGGATPLMYACQQSRENEVMDILVTQPHLVKDTDRTLKTPLHYCAENTTTKCAEAILQVGPQLVNAQDENGYSPLHLAVISGNKPLVKLLIAKGSDVNLYDNEGHSAVHWAIVSSEREALDLIIQAGADPSTPDIHGGYPLHYAVQMCSSNYETRKGLHDAIKVVEKLLRHGVNVNVMDKDGRQPILWAASAGSAQIIKDLIDSGARVDAADKDGLTALHCAASRGHTETIETLVTSCGAEVDVIDGNGCSALFYAVTLGHADATAILLQLGAQPNRQDRKGRTPAHCGAAKGQLETLRLVENFGGNLWIRNVKGDFPFHEAVASGRRDLVIWFLEKNPDAINIGNNDGRCPLHVAAMYNDVEMMKVLLEGKCLVNPVMRSSKGILMTPLNVALCKGHRSCAKILQLHGGVPFSKVSKSDYASYERIIRISPQRSRPTAEGICWEEEMISPSFTIIRTSLGDDGDDGDQETMQNEKKKVYRRRKKRRTRSRERISREDKAENDSEDSLQDERTSVRAADGSSNRPPRKEHDHHGSHNDGETQENARKKNEGTSVHPTSEPITTVIPTDNNGKDIPVDFQRDPLDKEDSFRVAPQKGPSSKKPKNLSLDYFPPGMQTISHLDSEITEPDLDAARTPNEPNTLEKDKTSGLSVTRMNDRTDSSPVRSSNQGESAEDTKTSAKETSEKEDGSKTSDLLSPSFTILKNDRDERIVQSEVNQSEYPKTDAPNQQKETYDKFTPIVQSRSTTVKKHEKTTKSIIKREVKVETEDNMSSTLSRKTDKLTKSTKPKDLSSNEKEANGTKAVQQNSEEVTQPHQHVIETSTVQVITTLSEKDVAEKNANDNEETITRDTADIPETFSIPIQPEDSTKMVLENIEPGTIPEHPSQNKETLFAETTKTDLPEPHSTPTKSSPSKKVSIHQEAVVVEIHQPHTEHDTTTQRNDRQEQISKISSKINSSDSNQENIKSEEPDKSMPMTKKEQPEIEQVKPQHEEAKAKLEPLLIPKGPQQVPDTPEISATYDQNRTTAAEEFPVKQEDLPSLKTTNSMPNINALDHSLNADQTHSVGRVKYTSRLQLPTLNKPAVSEQNQTCKNIHHGIHMEENSQTSLTEPTASEGTESKFKGSERGSENFIVTSSGAESPHEKRDEHPTRKGFEEHVEGLESTEESDGEYKPMSLPGKIDGNCVADDQGIGRLSKVSRLCRRNKNLREAAQVSVNQLVQGTIRKYHLERGIFHQLLELKRLQIRAGRANEQLLVKRLADEYERSCACLGMRHYTGTYRFKEFEKFLYDQLKMLNRGHLVLPEMKSYDDIDALSGILKKSRFKILSDLPSTEPQCACLTQRCHHSTKAYTTLPCSAYVASLRASKMHKQKKECFLPSIHQYTSDRPRFFSRPTTLELIQGDKKQVIELPPTQSDKTKKYYITFTIKSAHAFNESDYTENRKDYFKHRHAKSV